jgi:RNA polymerase-binding transcription factor DksA
MELSPELVADEAQTRMGITDLEAELAAIAESTAQVPDDEHDAEGSTVGYERARVTALLVTARSHLAELERAIGRIQRGEEGHCANCGAPIGDERRAALPATQLCLACAAPRYSGMFGRVI